MFLVSEIESMSLTGVFQRCGPIDKKHGVINVVFLAELGKKCMGENICSRWFKLCIEQFIRFRVDSGVQPILLVVESDHRLINHNVIRILSRLWL